MARRSDGVPHVIAYWWKSPSMARWAASISSRGGGKLGIPWARLMPSYWLLTRVISRITDSVNPWTRLEIMRREREALPAARDGRDDGDLVALLERGGRALQETDVLLVDVDVDEPPERAAVLDQALLEPGELALQDLDQIGHVRGLLRPGYAPVLDLRSASARSNAASEGWMVTSRWSRSWSASGVLSPLPVTHITMGSS